MNELIKVENKNGELLVSARELHDRLGIETRYNDWFKRMLKYGFEENNDYIPITQKRVTAQGNETTVRSLVEQILTGTDGKKYHVFGGQLIPKVCKAPANTSYTQKDDILFKVYHKSSVPYMSAFEVGTSFFNQASLTDTNFLTWGHNTLDYLKNYPCVTVKKA